MPLFVNKDWVRQASGGVSQVERVTAVAVVTVGHKEGHVQSFLDEEDYHSVQCEQRYTHLFNSVSDLLN